MNIIVQCTYWGKVWSSWLPISCTYLIYFNMYTFLIFLPINNYHSVFGGTSCRLSQLFDVPVIVIRTRDVLSVWFRDWGFYCFSELVSLVKQATSSNASAAVIAKSVDKLEGLADKKQAGGSKLFLAITFCSLKYSFLNSHNDGVQACKNLQ